MKLINVDAGLLRGIGIIMFIFGLPLFIFNFPPLILSGLLGSSLIISGAIFFTGSVICEYIKNSM